MRMLVVPHQSESDVCCSDAEVQEVEMSVIRKKKMKANATGKFASDVEVHVCKTRGWSTDTCDQKNLSVLY